jgi:hypothetical protein
VGKGTFQFLYTIGTFGLAFSTNAYAGNLFFDSCGQGDCVRGWIQTIERSNGIFSVRNKWAEYRSEDDPTVYKNIQITLDQVSCDRRKPWILIRADGPEPVPYDPNDDTGASEDKRNLWRAVCERKFINSTAIEEPPEQ